MRYRKPDPGDGNDPRIVLRGLGGQHHGRAYTLSQPCLVGRSAAAAIHIDEPGFAERHAQLERRGDRVLLRDLGSAAGSMVNGVAVRDALLAAGDQVAFGSQHRFVVEVPWQEVSSAARELADDSGREDGAGEGAAAANKHSMRRWPWLLLAALFLAATAQRAAAVRCRLKRFHSRQPSNAARIDAYSSGSRMSDFTSHQKCSTASTPTA